MALGVIIEPEEKVETSGVEKAMVLRLDERGCLKIPKSMIESLGLAPGMSVEVETLQGSLLVRPSVEAQPIEIRGGVPVFMGVAVGDLEACVENEREARTVIASAWDRG